MNDEKNGVYSTANPDDQPSSETPATKAAPAKSKIGEDAKPVTTSQENTTTELAREFRWIEIWTLVINGVLAVVGIGALTIYGCQLSVMRGQLQQMQLQLPEMRKSADAAKTAADATHDSFNLTKRHTEDTDEAVVHLRGELEPGTNIETIILVNTGQVTAHRVSAHVEIWRTSLPSNQRTKLLGKIDISQDELNKGGSGINKQIILPDVGQSDWDRIMAVKEGVAVNAVMEYENGFDSVRRPTECQELVMRLPYPQDSPQTPTGSLVDCDNVPVWLERERLTRQRLLGQQKPH